MWSFLKSFLAAILALIVFCIVAVFFFIGMIGGLASRSTVKVADQSVLIIDPADHYAEQETRTTLSNLTTGNHGLPGLYDLLRMIRSAAGDKKIAGIYLVANSNSNGFASSEEIRNALIDFKKSGKFIIAAGDVITQRAYSIANVADKIYLSPQGYLEWTGYNVDYMFLKGALDKLEIQPQIFYAGKFKSATEPLRAGQMTPENRLQTSVWLNDLYDDLLIKTAAARKLDTASLRRLANDASIQQAADAVNYKLVDGLRYDDQVKDEIRQKLGIDKYHKLNLVKTSTYFESIKGLPGRGGDIALIYAEGDVVDGNSESSGNIASQTYISLIRKARLDKSIKAIVFRINSGGGSSLASENIWRELELAKKEKPVVVSFGDVSASGAYYISMAADSIFALPTTITGSIGVFGIVPNMQSFFKNKLGVTFDGVKTAEHADAPSSVRPMTEADKRLFQSRIEAIYTIFKQRVAEGRKLDTAAVEAIAQGRVWTGFRALDIKLIDRFGGIQDAIDCAVRMAKVSATSIREYPEPRGLFEQLLGSKDPLSYEAKIREDMGEDNYRVYVEMKRVRDLSTGIQTRLPFQFIIH